ncbi:MAG: hypothetical protein ACFFDH_03400 [Promethearchaeota archaeon]
MAESFFDWEQQFKKEKKKLNLLGLTDEEFKKFLEDWKKKNKKKVNEND